MLFEILLNFGVVLRTQRSLHFRIAHFVLSIGVSLVIVIVFTEGVALRGVKILSGVHRVFHGV